MASNIYSLTLSWNIAGQFAANILHYVFDDGGYSTTQDAAAALVTKWDAISKTDWLAMLPNVTILLSAKARKATGSGGFEAAKPYPSSTLGTRVGEVSAAGINPCIIHYPSQAQAGRGKTFLPGVRELDCKDGVFTAAFQSAIATHIPTAFSALTLAGGGGPTAEFAIMKKTGSPRWFFVADSMLSDLVAQQRRRQRPA